MFFVTEMLIVNLFSVGIKYYIPIALSVALFIKSSFWNDDNVVLYRLVFTALAIVAFISYFFLNTTGTSVIILVFFGILAVELISYYAFQAGFTVGMFITGGTLFGIGYTMERYWEPIKLIAKTILSMQT